MKQIKNIKKPKSSSYLIFINKQKKFQVITLKKNSFGINKNKNFWKKLKD